MIGYYFISLKSMRFGVGLDDPYEGPAEIIPPTQDDVDKFVNFLNDFDIHGQYTQYFLP
jgi:hypothetical protein